MITNDWGSIPQNNNINPSVIKRKLKKLLGDPVQISEFKLKAKTTKNRGAFKSQLQRFLKFSLEKQKEFQKSGKSFKIICFGLIHCYYFDYRANGWRMFVIEASRKKVGHHFSWLMSNMN